MSVDIMNPIEVKVQPGSNCLNDFFLFGSNLNSKKKNVKQIRMNIATSITVLTIGSKNARNT